MKIKKLLTMMAMGGLLVSNGNAIVDAAQDGMIAFKEAYLSAPVDNRIFNENIDFFGPNFHGEVVGDGFIFRDASMYINGKIDWQYTNSSNETVDENIPFYIEQSNKDMIMYLQRNNRWSKLKLPAVPIEIANALKTTDVNILSQNMEAVKDVEVLDDTEEKRIMNITLDGPKLAELIKKYNENSIGSMTNDEKNFLGHLFDALQTTNVQCNWSVDKKTWQSISLTVNFTDLMRAYAKDVLDDAAKGEIVLNADDRSYYEALGYFSELHTKASYYKSDAKPTKPDGANYAQNNENIFNDMVKEIGKAAKK